MGLKIRSLLDRAVYWFSILLKTGSEYWSWQRMLAQSRAVLYLFSDQTVSILNHKTQFKSDYFLRLFYSGKGSVRCLCLDTFNITEVLPFFITWKKSKFIFHKVRYHKKKVLWYRCKNWGIVSAVALIHSIHSLTHINWNSQTEIISRWINSETCYSINLVKTVETQNISWLEIHKCKNITLWQAFVWWWLKKNVNESMTKHF